MGTRMRACTAVGLLAGLIGGCASAADNTPVEPEVAVEEPADEPSDDAGDEAADEAGDELVVEEPEPPAEPEPTVTELFDPSAFALASACTADNADGEPQTLELTDEPLITEWDGFVATLTTDVLGQLDSGALVLRTGCTLTGASSSNLETVEVLDLDGVGGLEQHTVAVREDRGDGPLGEVRLDGDTVAFTFIDRARYDDDGMITDQRATRVGDSWVTEPEGEPRRVLFGPAIEIELATDSALAWEVIEPCSGTVRGDDPAAQVLISGAGIGPEVLEQQRAEGALDLEQLPDGVADAVRLIGEGFDQVNQPVVRDEVVLADAQDRVIWLVALDGSAMLDEILAGVRLTDASDDVFEQSGRCEPLDYVG